MIATPGRVAVVTGASRGIGAAVAQRLAADGFRVVVNYSGDAAPAAELVKQLEANGQRALAARADVSDRAAVRALFDATEAEFGGIDVLVNNAGIMRLSPLAETQDEAFDRQIAVNLKGSFNTMREAAVRLRSGGLIINFSSSVVGMLQPGYGVYAATKAAVEAMTSVLAKELRGRAITVNAVAPGPTATDLFLDGKPRQVIESLAKLATLERLGQPTDIAAIVSFLAGMMVHGSTDKPFVPTAESSDRQHRLSSRRSHGECMVSARDIASEPSSPPPCSAWHCPRAATGTGTPHQHKCLRRRSRRRQRHALRRDHLPRTARTLCPAAWSWVRERARSRHIEAVGEGRSYSRGSVTAQDHPHRARKYLGVQPERPLGRIAGVECNPLLIG